MGIEIPEGWGHDLLYNLPYGPGLWESLALYPNEFSSQMNVILHMAEFSCNGDFWLYVETLLPAVGELWILIFDFEWDDVARGWLRPSGIRTRWKFRPGKKGKRGGKKGGKLELPEWGELVGSKLPCPLWLRGIMASKPFKWLWRIDGILQRGLFYFMVVDVAKDFAYTWSSGLLRARGCWENAAGWIYGGPGTVSFPADGGVYSSGLPMPRVSGGALPPSGFPLVIPPGRTAEMLFALGGHQPVVGKVTSAECWIELSDGRRLGGNGAVDADNFESALPISYAKIDNAGTEPLIATPRVTASTSSVGATAFFSSSIGAIRWVAPAS